MSEIVRQKEISRLHHESSLFPDSLRVRGSGHRLHLAGEIEAMAGLLDRVRLKGYAWLVFASEDAAEDAPKPLTAVELNRKQRKSMSRLCMYDRLVYGIFNSLGDASELMTSSLWDQGAGLAFPIASAAEPELDPLVEVQLEHGEKLVQALAEGPGAFVLACTDAWGVDIVWNPDSPAGRILEKIGEALNSEDS